MTEDVRRIRIERSGGFAGVAVTVEVDDPEEIQRLRKGIDARAVPAPSVARDVFTYRFEFLSAGGEPTLAVEVPEGALPPETRELLGRLLSRR